MEMIATTIYWITTYTYMIIAVNKQEKTKVMAKTYLFCVPLHRYEHVQQ